MHDKLNYTISESNKK